MSDYDQPGILDTLLGPLTLPGRAARDLGDLGAAARELPAQLTALRNEVRGVGRDLEASVERLGERLETLEGQVAAVRLDLAATRTAVQELRGQVSEAIELLPDAESRGPIARARDAITGTEP
jgi:ATP/maltotriose-dependent transcriptional regulator MalT